jgi:hypothetical protein
LTESTPAELWHWVQVAFASVPFVPAVPAGPIGPSHAVNRKPVESKTENRRIRFFISGYFIKISFCNLHKSYVIPLTVGMLFIIFIIDRYTISR